MATHTPGPWIWADGYAGLNSPALGPVLDYAPYEGMWVTHYTERGKADARLIAAAPELLEALQRLLHNHAANTLFSGNGHWEQARAAIAKAQG